MQYAHDTLGNRTSRVRGVLTREMGQKEINADTLFTVYFPEDSLTALSSYEISEDSEKDTSFVKKGSLIKTLADKEAYLREIMASTAALEPIKSQGQSRDINTYNVGAIPLQFGVSQTGARTYSIPIATAPDIKYTPSLALVYNNQGGYGYGGYGWDLAGLSQITLASKTLYYDNTIKPADASDTSAVFMLDGIRLVRNDDSATSSAYPLVTAQGHILAAPVKNAAGYVQYFNVRFPNGVSAVYGSTTFSMNSQFLTYPMVESVNLDGERIEYRYTFYDPGGCSYLNSVFYGFDSSGDAAGIILFDMIGSQYYQYYAGRELWRKPTIEAIYSKSGNQTLYKYELDYESQDSADLLTRVSLFNSTNEELPPLEFTYGMVSPHVGRDSLLVNKTLSLSSYFDSQDAHIFKRGKFTKGCYNDGLITYPVRDNYTSHTGNPNQFISGYGPNQVILSSASVADVTYVDHAIKAQDGFQTIEPVDIDGDGIEELVAVNFGQSNNNGTRYFFRIYGFETDGATVLKDTCSVRLSGYICRHTIYSPYRRAFRWGDFYGDGRVEVLGLSYSANGYGDAQTCYFSLIDLEEGALICEQILFSFPFGKDKTVFCLDIDGDGMTELCHATFQGTDIYKIGASGSFVWNKRISTLTESIIDSDDAFFVDVNADGYVDIVRAPQSGYTWSLYRNTGTDFESESIVLGTKTSNDTYFFIDINRDGYPDALKTNSNSNSFGYYLNMEGLEFDEYKPTYSTITNTAGVLPANVVDYTSMSSFIKVDGQYIKEYKFTSIVPELRQLVQSTDSYGKIVRNEYGYLPSSSLYWTDDPTGISAADGYQLRVMPIYVLRGTKGFMSSDSTAPAFMEESYSWYDGVVNTRGLGFCGFSKNIKMTVTDERGTRCISKFDPQRMGVPTSVEENLSFVGLPEISSVFYTWDNHSTTYGKLSPRLSQSVSTDYLTGVSTTTTYSYDSFDYPTIINTTSRIGTNTISVSDERTYSHSNLPAKYVLGAVTEQNVIRGRMGERTVYTYDSSFHPLTKNDYKVQISGPAAHPIYNYYATGRERWTYDSHGNVLTVESSPYNATEFTGNSYTYDSSGRHLTSSTNALGQTTTYSNFDRFGNPRTVTDYRSRIKTNSYDEWGNQTKTVYADGTIDSTAIAWGGQGVYIATRTVTGKPSTIVHYDALSRQIRSGNQRFNGQWQYSDTEYNRRGVVKRVSMPYTGSTPTYWNTYTFDDYGRKKKFTEASGRTTKWFYSGVSVTEQKDSITITRTTNALGELVSVTDAAGTITYTLRDDGQPSSVTAPGGASTTFNYDNYGRRTKITDPSAGERSTSYLYNSDGSSVVTETNAIGSVATSHDKYGRVTGIVRTGIGAFNTTYTYDTYGRLSSVSSTNSTSEEYTYDAYDRVSTVKETVPDSNWLQKTYTFGAGSNVSSIAYTSQGGYITTETYSYTNGHNTSIMLPDGTDVLTLLAENSLGQPTSATSGNVSRIYSYTPFGFPTGRMLMYNGSTRQYLQTTFEPRTGNLTSRCDASHGTPSTTENFTYDSLGRLTSDYTGSISYDIKGNLTSIASVGTMTYPDSAHPYRISRLNASSVFVTMPNSQTVTYTAYDRPAALTEGPPIVVFSYNADYDRVRMLTTVYGSTVMSKHYIGKRYEKEYVNNGTTTERLFVGGDAYSAPMVLQRTGNGAWTPYVIGRDYLGSITHILNTNGTLVAEYSYDAWGRMRDQQTLAPYASTSQPSLLIGRGYCGHEHLSNFGLINMNARLYDPVLGRFLSPDPYVQSPDFSQNFNRYAYALNNPLKYTDESGEFAISTMLMIGGISALIFGAGNLTVHVIRDDDLNNGKWADFFFGGALAGFVVGSIGYAGFSLCGTTGFLGALSRFTLKSVGVVEGLKNLSNQISIIGGAINQGWSGIENAGKLMLGNFYLDENKEWYQQAGEGILRHTWEYYQQSAGYIWSGIRNCWADRVDYYGGVTFVTNENATRHNGVTLGGFINGNLKKVIPSGTSFDDYINRMDQLYAHEYGHTKQSRLFGISYPIIGLLSLGGAIADYRLHTGHNHNAFFTEVMANRFSSLLFPYYTWGTADYPITY